VLDETTNLRMNLLSLLGKGLELLFGNVLLIERDIEFTLNFGAGP
jgi:hypothetical protein